MKRLDLSLDSSWLTAEDGARFVPLGYGDATTLGPIARDRIQRKTASPQQELWGTLGTWEGGKRSSPKGELRFSTRGNLSSVPEESGDETVYIIGQVDQTRRPGLPDSDAGRIVERFIDARRLSFPGRYPSTTALGEQPSLRLTLFVQPGEGAQVWVEQAEGEASVVADSAILILPEPTSADFNCSHRDRLHYRIPIWPRDGIFAAKSNLEKGATLRTKPGERAYDDKLVIKVLTFRRANSTSHEVVRRAAGALGRRDPNRLLRWSTQSHDFVSTEELPVKHDAKTLMLVHGTFSSTSGSFGQLYKGGPQSWMHDVASSRRYQQILAIDHDTLFDGLAENEAHLNTFLETRLLQPVDLLTHSRGGLFGKRLAIRGTHVQVERAVLGACANGVGYLKALNQISWFLTVLSKAGKYSGVGGLALVLAQHSAKFVKELPGLKPMTPGSRELNAVMRRPVRSGRTKTKFLPMVGDWKATGRWYQQLGQKGVDTLLKAILGAKHDWVVGSKEQAIVAPGHLARDASTAPVINSLHTRYYGKEDTLAYLREHLIRK